MRRLLVLFLAAAALVSITTSADAWNSIGHMVVGKLAYDQLDSKCQLALSRLLKSHPHYKDYLAAGRPADVENETEWIVMRCGVWPDWVRPRKNDKRDVSRHHRGEEHYINIPFIDPKDEAAFAGKTLIDPDLPNIVTALKQHTNVLKTKTAAAEDRAVAACWVFHLVGDIHQPLHNVSYFSSAFPEGDLGGNRFGIRAAGRKHRLHAFWDELLGPDSDYADDSAGHQVKLYREALKLAVNLRGLKLTDEDNEQLRQNKTFESWSGEGFNLARTVAYQKSDGTGLLKHSQAGLNGVGDDAAEVGPKYIENARALAERRVVMAGRRLADRLAKVLPGE